MGLIETSERMELAALSHLHVWGRNQITGHSSVELMLQLCPDDECSLCGIVACPNGEPGHFNHNGCPVCVQERRAENARAER